MNSHDAMKKKAFEISYALFRVAGAIHRKNFGDYLEGEALDLMRSVAKGDFRAATGILHSIEYFLRLGAEMNLVNPSNAQLLMNEVNSLNSAIIAALENTATVAELEIKHIFERQVNQEKKRENLSIQEEKTKKEKENEEKSYGYEEEGDKQEQRESIGNNAAIVAEYVSRMRQSAILDRIRELDNCRLRDIQERFPDTSERTIRYDLQTLVEQGLVERMGSGGPGSYYRITGERAPAPFG